MANLSSRFEVHINFVRSDDSKAGKCHKINKKSSYTFHISNTNIIYTLQKFKKALVHFARSLKMVLL